MAGAEEEYASQDAPTGQEGVPFSQGDATRVGEHVRSSAGLVRLREDGYGASRGLHGVGFGDGPDERGLDPLSDLEVLGADRDAPLVYLPEDFGFGGDLDRSLGGPGPIAGVLLDQGRGL